MAQTTGPSLYSRLGGLLPRLQSDPRLARFWSAPRSTDTNRHERQMAVDFISASAGGPTFYQALAANPP